ncbi:MAG: tyrosine-type recombinase/integrase [Longicatena sp.]
MKKIKLNVRILQKYRKYLKEEERSKATQEKYMRDVSAYYEFLPEDKVITKENLLAYKQYLSDKGYKISSINSMLVAINRFLLFLNLSSLRLKLHKCHRSVFYNEAKEMTKGEYHRLLIAARNNQDERLYMLLQTICATGIRVSEHQYITVEALHEGKASVLNKGKRRDILLSKELRKILLKYCVKSNIKSGPIFITKNGKPLDRSNIWSMMKELCKLAKVEAKKVFPHNLRHLFALTYYRITKDIIRLADLLGHASVNTTRIYTMTDGKACQRSLSKLDLVPLLN